MKGRSGRGFIIDILKLHRGMTGIGTWVMGRTVRDGAVHADDGLMGRRVME